jgi:hypothetical protein
MTPPKSKTIFTFTLLYHQFHFQSYHREKDLEGPMGEVVMIFDWPDFPIKASD